jgi:hypothetical protein
MKRQLMVMEQVTPPTSRPFRLVEVYMTSDGLRTRVCSGNWKTQAEAETERCLRLAGEVSPVKEEGYSG